MGGRGRDGPSGVLVPAQETANGLYPQRRVLSLQFSNYKLALDKLCFYFVILSYSFFLISPQKYNPTYLKLYFGNRKCHCQRKKAISLVKSPPGYNSCSSVQNYQFTITVFSASILDYKKKLTRK